MTSPLHYQVNSVLDQFGAHVGLEGCGLDEDGGAQFALDDVFVSLLLDDDNGSLVLMSSIGQPKASEKIYGRLLDANLFWSGAAGSTLAREAASHSIVLQRALPVAELDIIGFEAALQSFVNTAERLRDTLVDGEEDAEPADASPLADNFLRG